MPRPLMRPLAATATSGAGPRVEPLTSGLCARAGADAHEPGECESQRLADALQPGRRRFEASGLELELERVDHGDACTLTASVHNPGHEPVWLESVLLGFRFAGHQRRSLRFLRHGWQSWSYTDVCELDPAGTPAFPSGPWLRGMYHAIGAPAAERAGWHESATLSLVGGSSGGPCCLAGVLESGSAFGVVWQRRVPGETAVQIEVELRAEVMLAAGESRRLEATRIAVGEDATLLLERFAELWGRIAGARRNGPFQAGWCSWYHFFHRVSEEDLLRNLDALAADRQQIPVGLVQLDDGYQSAIGDWLETNAKFPSGLPAIAQAIREAGFSAGLWTAPFAASRESRLLSEHPDFALRDGPHWLRGSYNPEWSEDGWVYALDTSHPELIRHLEQLFRSLVEMGFDYQKLDFLYMAAMQGEAVDPSQTRAERLRSGLAAIRAGAGAETFLLGCGCPLGPAVGLMDGMRIGPDVAPSWHVDQPVVIPGLEHSLPSTHSALRSTLLRLFMHRRLWQNDPDCLMVRRSDTALAAHEADSLASVIAASGGMVLFSDDVGGLSRAERTAVRSVTEFAREVDAAAPRGAARLHAPLARAALRVIEAGFGRDTRLCAVNLSDAPARRELDLARMNLPPGSLEHALELGAHASLLRRLPRARELVVFCDFDGTFSRQDVGSTLARRYLADRRATLWQRFDRGELDAWEYAVLLFDGFDFPREDLDRFLETIELDPGARALVAWCDRNGVELRILSDGFDYNLARLRALHGLRFAYSANTLHFEGDRWRIAPGGRNPDCSCGTGTCKRAAIESWRAQRPGSFCIHIGNGRVSDLCGALVADLVFAKDTLAPALAERGSFHYGFESLKDVVEVLRRI